MRNINAYQRSIEDMKHEILSDIREIMEKEKYHKFQEPVYIHYIEYEVATTEKCVLLEYSDGDGKFLFQTNHLSASVDITTSDFEDKLMRYDFDSLVAIYSTLIAELRTEKIQYIREIVQEHGNKIEFAGIDGKKPIYLAEGEAIVLTNVTNVRIADAGYLAIRTEKSSKVVGKEVWVCDLDLEEINRLLKYVKDATEKTFNVTASNVLSRTFEVKAASWEEAVEKAKAMLDKEPLNEDDGMGVEFY
jgi:hypothetical protein